MVRKLSNIFLLLSCLLAAAPLCAQDQPGEERASDQDYKDANQFEKFARRRKMISAWQVNQLKNGALVVRLKTNQLLVNALLKQGNRLQAEEKRLEQVAINVNTMRAYRNYYTFSKLYFIYSNSSDSLLNGARSNIFLDSNLRVDANIVMTEKFYMIAERDYAYNSSIGFVPEDSARKVIEKGNAVREMAIVVKNKYGHQLKNPFPYAVTDKTNFKSVPAQEIVMIEGRPVVFNVGGITRGQRKTEKGKVIVQSNSFKFEGKEISVTIPKYLTYNRISMSVARFNDELTHYYRSSPDMNIEKMDPYIKRYMY